MNDVYRRRRLRLGALLYQLQYYAVPDQRDLEGQIMLYRRDALQCVEVSGSTVRLVAGDAVEVLDLEAAIARCKEALLGQPFHHASGNGT